MCSRTIALAGGIHGINGMADAKAWLSAMSFSVSPSLRALHVVRLGIAERSLKAAAKGNSNRGQWQVRLGEKFLCSAFVRSLRLLL
jgi:hypothetical protein